MHEGCRRKPRGVQTSPGNGWLMGSKAQRPSKGTLGSCWLQLKSRCRKGSCRRKPGPEVPGSRLGSHVKEPWRPGWAVLAGLTLAGRGEHAGGCREGPGRGAYTLRWGDTQPWQLPLHKPSEEPPSTLRFHGNPLEITP